MRRMKKKILGIAAFALFLAAVYIAENRSTR